MFYQKYQRLVLYVLLTKCNQWKDETELYINRMEAEMAEKVQLV